MKEERKALILAFGFMIGMIATMAGIRVHEAKAEKLKELEQWTTSIVYTEDTAFETTTDPTDYTEESDVAPLLALTQDEREWIATLVAGKAVDRTAGCQQAVATVVLNEILDCDGDIEQAVRKYGLNDQQTPTDKTFDAVDAVFVCGEVLLDDDVLWFNDKNHNSEFHAGLIEVCEIDGMNFYKAKR